MLQNKGKLIIQMYLTWFAITLLAVILVFTAGMANSSLVLLLGTILAIALYLGLIYMTAWDFGQKEAVKKYNADNTKARNIQTGIIVMLLSSVHVILLAVVYLIAYLIQTTGDMMFAVAGSLDILGRMIINGAYLGIYQLFLGADRLTTPLFFILCIIPGPLFGTLGYVFGFYNKKLLRYIGINTDKLKKDLKNR